MELKEKVKEYLLKEENEETLINVVKELNNYNTCLDDLQYEINDEEFFETYYSNNPAELARAICYGNYDYNDEYVKIDAYGNLVSANEYEVIEEYKDRIGDIKDCIGDIVDCLIENKDYIDFYDTELEDMLQEEEEEEEEEEE